MKPEFLIGASEGGITEVELQPKRQAGRAEKLTQKRAAWRWKNAATKELRAYFAGRIKSFSTPCDLGGLPVFTRAVLRQTAKIPYGQVRSYEWLARKLGKPRAARAVGNALAKNPIPVIIPCHRIVRSDGSIGGYALGRAWKKKLLDLERKFTATGPT